VYGRTQRICFNEILGKTDEEFVDFLSQVCWNNFGRFYHGFGVHKVRKEKQVAFITLNRPDRLNAIGPEIYRDWTAALDEAERDDDVKVCVFKGAGRAFSAGADLTGVGYVYGMKDPKPGEKGKQRITPESQYSNSTGVSSWIFTEEFSIARS